MKLPYKSLMVAAAAIVAINSPWLIEGRDNNCAAFESLAVRSVVSKQEERAPVMGAALMQGLMALSNGRMAAQKAAERLPGVPAPLACLMGYYNGLSGSNDGPAKPVVAAQPKMSGPVPAQGF